MLAEVQLEERELDGKSNNTPYVVSSSNEKAKELETTELVNVLFDLPRLDFSDPSLSWCHLAIDVQAAEQENFDAEPVPQLAVSTGILLGKLTTELALVPKLEQRLAHAKAYLRIKFGGTSFYQVGENVIATNSSQFESWQASQRYQAKVRQHELNINAIASRSLASSLSWLAVQLQRASAYVSQATDENAGRLSSTTNSSNDKDSRIE